MVIRKFSKYHKDNQYEAVSALSLLVLNSMRNRISLMASSAADTAVIFVH
jgi:hypothetical protein